jgi:CheY-like chemotaxis protein
MPDPYHPQAPPAATALISSSASISSAMPHGAADRAGRSMARITVVNDNPEFLETMFSILDGYAGHDVAGFSGDQTSIEELVASDPELLIVDLRMAGDDMRGWEILMLARAEESLRHVPLIECSGDIQTLSARAD